MVYNTNLSVKKELLWFEMYSILFIFLTITVVEKSIFILVYQFFALETGIHVNECYQSTLIFVLLISVFLFTDT